MQHLVINKTSKIAVKMTPSYYKMLENDSHPEKNLSLNQSTEKSQFDTKSMVFTT